MALKHNKQQSLQQHVLQQHHGTVDSQSEGSILKLPVEILDMIATKLDDYGLKSMRSTCRHLRIGTFYEFAERSTSSHVEIVTTNGKIAMRKLTVTLRSPNLVKAKAAMTQLLALHDPLYANEIHPEKTLVSNTVTSNPNAWTFQQQKNYRQAHEHCLAPLIFARVAYLPPHHQLAPPCHRRRRSGRGWLARGTDNAQAPPSPRGSPQSHYHEIHQLCTGLMPF